MALMLTMPLLVPFPSLLMGRKPLVLYLYDSIHGMDRHTRPGLTERLSRTEPATILPIVEDLVEEAPSQCSLNPADPRAP